MSETLTWADSIETEKIRTHHAKIVVECTTGKPYYSIEWFDAAKQEYYVGYRSYVLDNVLGWLKEYFEIVEAPQTNADRIRSMSDEELADFLSKEIWRCDCYKVCKECPRWIGNCCLPLDEWLQQPTEGEKDGRAVLHGLPGQG